MLVFVVAKNVRVEQTMLFGEELRLGCATAGAKAHSFLASFRHG